MGQMLLLVIVFFVGLLSSALSSLTGGGAALITVPLLLVFGVPPYTAVSTPKVGALGIALGSLLQFSKKNYVRWTLVPVLCVLAVLAGVIGAQLLLVTPEYIVKNLVIVLLIISLAILWSHKDMGVIAFTVSSIRKLTGYLAYFVSELFRAAFGSGFGMLTNTVLVFFFGLTTLESAATKRIPGVIVTTAALITFMIHGVVDIKLGIALFIGSLVGSYAGTHCAILIGNRWTKYLFTCISVLLITLLIFSETSVRMF